MAYIRKELSLKDKLFEKAYVFDFLQAVRVFQSLYPDTVAPAEGVDPEKEPVRFSASVSFAFPPSDLVETLPASSFSRVDVLQVNFLGIAGIQGPLPTPYTQLLVDRIQKKDLAFRDFLDIFNHRFISLFHKIRKRHRMGIYEIPAEKTTIGEMLRALTGLGFQNPLFQNKLKVSDRGLLGLASFLWPRVRSSIGLKFLLEKYLRIPVTIHEFQGKWLSIQKEECSLIGTQKGQFNVLGKDCILGTKAWDKVGHITASLGPMGLTYFCNFFRNQESYKKVCDLITFYTEDSITFDLNLILKKEEVPSLVLGQDSFLGWRTWLKTKPFLQDARQVYIHPSLEDSFA